jgi:acetyltransferase-like isoleucine patch superfamily enzyme
MWSQTFRELVLAYYDVEIGSHSYGPCLRPGFLPPGTRLGNYCSFAPGIHVLRRNHPTDRLSQHPFFFNSSTGLLAHDSIPAVDQNPLTIGHDVWVGLGVAIAPGCRNIGDGAVIAAHSVVTADVPPLAIVGGVPARFIRWRFPEQLHDAWLQSGWWLKPVDALAAPVDAFLEPFGAESESLRSEADRMG